MRIVIFVILISTYLFPGSTNTAARIPSGAKAVIITTAALTGTGVGAFSGLLINDGAGYLLSVPEFNNSLVYGLSITTGTLSGLFGSIILVSRSKTSSINYFPIGTITGTCFGLTSGIINSIPVGLPRFSAFSALFGSALGGLTGFIFGVIMDALDTNVKLRNPVVLKPSIKINNKVLHSASLSLLIRI